MSTIKDTLDYGTNVLTKARLENARLDPQVLLAHILGVERVTLYAYPERQLTDEQEQQFHILLARREHREPVAYLVGHKEFYGLDFLVDSRVLIPRPETEFLVEAALSVIGQMFDVGSTPIVADIGTGSGAIPITLAVEEPWLPYLYATDISADALNVARLNCQRHHVEQRIRLLQGDLVAPLPEPIDVLTANLPYVGTNEMNVLTRDVQAYEPYLALFSGVHGLDLLYRFLQEVHHMSILKEKAVMVLEIGYQQRESLIPLLRELWPQAVVTFRKDYAGWDRVLQVNLN